MRPGRIDKKIEYKLATKSQARALFDRFFPAESRTKYTDTDSDEKAAQMLREQSTAFAEQLPEDEFTTAELQGYLLSHKKDPEGAVKDLMKWIESERAERQRRKEAEEKERLKSKERAQRMAAVQGARQGFGAFGNPVVYNDK